MPCKSWSLEAITTCPASIGEDGELVDACKGCYATTGFYLMPEIITNKFKSSSDTQNSGFFKRTNVDCREFKYCNYTDSNKFLSKEVDNSFIKNKNKCFTGETLNTFTNEKKYIEMAVPNSVCDKYYKFDSTTDVKECEQLCRNEPNCNKFTISDEEKCRYSSCDDNIDSTISSIKGISPSKYKEQLIALALFCRERVS